MNNSAYKNLIRALAKEVREAREEPEDNYSIGDIVGNSPYSINSLYYSSILAHTDFDLENYKPAPREFFNEVMQSAAFESLVHDVEIELYYNKGIK